METELTPVQITEKLEQHCMTQVMLASKILVRPETLTAYMKGKTGKNTKVGKRAFWYFERLEGK